VREDVVTVMSAAVEAVGRGGKIGILLEREGHQQLVRPSMGTIRSPMEEVTVTNSGEVVAIMDAIMFAPGAEGHTAQGGGCSTPGLVTGDA
jgi:hypothetical protein